MASVLRPRAFQPPGRESYPGVRPPPSPILFPPLLRAYSHFLAAPGGGGRGAEAMADSGEVWASETPPPSLAWH